MPAIPPVAPAPMMWSIRLRPTSPLELARPLGKLRVCELSRIRADSSVEAQRKTTRRRELACRIVFASTTLTPFARRVRSSKITTVDHAVGPEGAAAGGARGGERHVDRC